MATGRSHDTDSFVLLRRSSVRQSLIGCFINAISSKVSVIILLLAFMRGDYGFIDVALSLYCVDLWEGLDTTVMTPGDWQLKLPGLGGFEGEEEEAASY